MFWKSKEELSSLDGIIICSEEIEKDIKSIETEIIELERQLRQKQVQQNKNKRMILILKNFFKLKTKNMKANLQIWNDLNKYLKDLGENLIK